jgi:hypothetical protein
MSPYGKFLFLDDRNFTSPLNRLLYVTVLHQLQLASALPYYSKPNSPEDDVIYVETCPGTV